MSKTGNQGFMGLNPRRVLLAAIAAGVIKVGVMDLWLELRNPLGLNDAAWATIIYMTIYIALGALSLRRRPAAKDQPS